MAPYGSQPTTDPEPFASHATDAPGGRRVRLWILNHYAAAPDVPTGTRHYSLARAVMRRNGDVTIFASAFEHVVGRSTRLRPGRLLRTQYLDGVRFVWVWTIAYRGNDLRRMANMLSYAAMVVLAAPGRARPDVVMGSSVHPFAALAGWLIAKVHRARFLYEIRDLWPQTLIDIGAMRADSLGARLLYGIEAFLARRADAVVALLPGIARYLEERGLPSHHVWYLPNGADLDMADVPATSGPDRHDPLQPILDDLARQRREGTVLFAYVGAHGRVNRLEIPLRAAHAAASMTQQPILLLFVGDGPEKEALQREAEEQGITNVRFVDPIPKSSVPRFLDAVDVGVIHTTYTPVYRYGISFNKLFDYMAAAKPVAFACTTSDDPVKASGAGLTVAPDDPTALARAMVELATMTAAERAEMGAAGRAYLERSHDMRRIGDRFADLVLGSDRRPPATP